MRSSLSICTAPCRYVAPWMGVVAGVCDVQVAMIPIAAEFES
jgi:hypothetical protein